MTTEGSAPSFVEREALALYEVATEASINLRLIGSLAVRLRCARYGHLMEALARREARDIDFVAYGRDEPAIERLFEGRGYELHPGVRHSREFGIQRLIYRHPTEDLKVDVFLDRLIMAHTIEFSSRLGLDAPTVTLVDLLLSKLQIHEVTENDLIDTAVLLAEHPLSGTDGIDLAHLARVLGNDWGFCHSALLNLDKLEAALDRWTALSPDVAERVRRQVAALRHAIEAAPKSTRWKLRARIGERVRWYEEVGEVDR
ncbi:MAG: hypothetical protein HYU54_06755 [Actinobacteria bacterium]|nr:hypothetical protein [Actinomycetota bacterium]